MGHCINSGVNKDSLEVRLGEHRLDTFDETLIVKDFNVDLIVNAPDYNSPSINSNDISLVRLASPADLSVYTPVCLPSHLQDFTGLNSTVTGWGATTEGGALSDVLQELSGLEVLTDSQCSSALSPDISADMLCAG